MNRYNRGGLFALFVLGGYFLYRNRASVQEWFEARGIKTPLDTSGKLRDTIRSGIAKLKGSAEHELGEAEGQIRRVS